MDAVDETDFFEIPDEEESSIPFFNAEIAPDDDFDTDTLDEDFSLNEEDLSLDDEFTDSDDSGTAEDLSDDFSIDEDSDF